MRVLTLTGTRTFNVVLRDYATSTIRYNIIIFNENTRQNETEIEISKTVSEIQANMNQLEITYTADRVEGDELSFYVVGKGESKILHRNKLFFTAKTPQNYTINE